MFISVLNTKGTVSCRGDGVSASNFVKMKRLICLMAVLFISPFLYPQLVVKPSPQGKDNYVYVKGKALYVKDYIHLQKNTGVSNKANLYLRKEAQLLQGAQQQKANSGNGQISIYQEGTSNAYDYNYWSSPVTTPENGLFGISMLGSPKDVLTSTAAVITSSLNGTANPLSISNRWIYTFSGSDYSSWQYIGGGVNITPGLGFSMKGVDGKDLNIIEGQQNNPGNAQRYDFRGKPNSGIIEVPVLPQEYVLIGNPYPSAVDLSLFLLENSGEGTVKTNCYSDIQRNNATTGIAYFWDSQENGDSHYLQDYVGGYGAFSPIDPCTTGVYEKPIFLSYGAEAKGTSQLGKDYKRRFLPVAQGFMVQGVEKGKIIFSNSQRVFEKEGNNSDFKSATTKIPKELEIIPKVRLSVEINKNYTRSLTLAFWPSSTTGFDAGMDAEAYDVVHADVGFLIDNKNFVINVRPLDLVEEIPLFLKVENDSAAFNFRVTGLENFTTKNILIFDSETNDYHDISEEPLELVLQKGDFNGRFKLAFVEKFETAELPEELEIDVEEEVNFSVFQNNYMQELEIISDSFSPVKSVGIFDLQGKKLFFRSNFPNKRSIGISTANWAPGIYIVKIMNSENRLSTKKISIFKNK